MVNVNDPRGMSEQVENALARLEAAHDRGEITDDDYNAIKSCYNRYAGRKWATGSAKRTRVRELCNSAVHADTALTTFKTIDDVNRLLQTLYDGGAKAASTQRGYTAALGAFYEHLDGHQDWPDYPFRDDIEPITDGDSDTGKIDPGEILDWDEVHALRGHANRPRDATLITFLADTGLRIGAASALRVRDIHGLNTQTPTFTPNPNASGQKGILDHEMGEFPIHDSQRYLRQWINEQHPEAPDPHPDAPLWPKLRGYDPDDRENSAVGPRTIQHHVRNVADDAGIEKPVNLHNFRHACVKHLKLEYDYDWTDLRDKLAWSDAAVSEMAQRYGKLDGDERLERLQAKHGVEIDDDHSAPEPKPCPNCGSSIPVSANHCPQCGIDPDERQQAQKSVGELSERVEQLEGMLSDLINPDGLINIDDKSGGLNVEYIELVGDDGTQISAGRADRDDDS